MLFWKDVGNGILLDAHSRSNYTRFTDRCRVLFPRCKKSGRVPRKTVRWWRWWPQHRGWHLITAVKRLCGYRHSPSDNPFKKCIWHWIIHSGDSNSETVYMKWDADFSLNCIFYFVQMTIYIFKRLKQWKLSEPLVNYFILLENRDLQFIKKTVILNSYRIVQL